MFTARIQWAVHAAQGADCTVDDFLVYKEDPNRSNLIVEPTEENWRITKQMWQGHRMAVNAAMRLK